MDELYDPNRFTFDYPLWIIFDTTKMKNPQIDPFEALAKGIGNFKDGREGFIAIFTDSDLADRFINEFHLSPSFTKAIDRGKFFGIMGASEAHGFNYVGFDVCRTGGKWFKIQDILPKV